MKWLLIAFVSFVLPSPMILDIFPRNSSSIREYFAICKLFLAPLFYREIFPMSLLQVFCYVIASLTLRETRFRPSIIFTRNFRYTNRSTFNFWGSPVNWKLNWCKVANTSNYKRSRYQWMEEISSRGDIIRLINFLCSIDSFTTDTAECGKFSLMTIDNFLLCTS